ncbi:hypothetical protein BKE38_03870 [Pseudoroseomonas deserti]|uniref:HTH tetR-type domain-containing protein n=1 Tax=Teichococcus deserti TaxID=1817963 RepID=A0A1V2H8Z2_9PROT|nr:TetR family transcriptional regulator [Pseudoroseomonas deserti]ONG57910.1 hypothetical protein BKE38_03870 [Pseudoroseomonas deserti]
MERKRRHDPERRARIIEAALSVIAEHGVAGCTHRRVAEAADVPLGSMTYHFDGIDSLLAEAFALLSGRIAEDYRATLRAAPDIAAAREAVVALICNGPWGGRGTMTQIFELYAWSTRHPDHAGLMSGWMAQSREALEAHFTPAQARALDAMIEGVMIHNLASAALIPPEEVRAIVRALTGG